MSLLPSHHDQFRSKEYWDRFFLERGGEQFEWYGTYEEIEVGSLDIPGLQMKWIADVDNSLPGATAVINHNHHNVGRCM